MLGVAYYLPKNLEVSCAEETLYDNAFSLSESLSSLPAPMFTKPTDEIPREEIYVPRVSRNEEQVHGAEVLEMEVAESEISAGIEEPTEAMFRPRLLSDGLQVYKLVIAIDFGTTLCGVSYRSAPIILLF